jgi:hypothetical protein
LKIENLFWICRSMPMHMALRASDDFMPAAMLVVQSLQVKYFFKAVIDSWTFTVKGKGCQTQELAI